MGKPIQFKMTDEKREELVQQLFKSAKTTLHLARALDEKEDTVATIRTIEWTLAVTQTRSELANALDKEVEAYYERVPERPAN